MPVKAKAQAPTPDDYTHPQKRKALDPDPWPTFNQELRDYQQKEKASAAEPPKKPQSMLEMQDMLGMYSQRARATMEFQQCQTHCLVHRQGRRRKLYTTDETAAGTTARASS